MYFLIIYKICFRLLRIEDLLLQAPDNPPSWIPNIAISWARRFRPGSKKSTFYRQLKKFHLGGFAGAACCRADREEARDESEEVGWGWKKKYREVRMGRSRLQPEEKSSEEKRNTGNIREHYGRFCRQVNIFSCQTYVQKTKNETNNLLHYRKQTN